MKIETIEKKIVELRKIMAVDDEILKKYDRLLKTTKAFMDEEYRLRLMNAKSEVVGKWLNHHHKVEHYQIMIELKRRLEEMRLARKARQVMISA